MSEYWLQEQINDLSERIDDIDKQTAARFWFYKPGSFGGLRHNLLPWIGSDGNTTYYRPTLVIPFFGLGALIIGLRWRRFDYEDAL